MKRRVIKVEVPKEIWDAHMCFWNMFTGKDIVGSWIKSIKEAVQQCKIQ